MYDGTLSERPVQTRPHTPATSTIAMLRAPPLLLLLGLAGASSSPPAVVVDVHPGELRRCVASGATRCHLLPGIHRESASAVAGAPPVELTGAPGSVLSGAAQVPGPWTQHSGQIYKTQLPPSLVGKDIQQVWAAQTWIPEARWP